MKKKICYLIISICLCMLSACALNDPNAILDESESALQEDMQENREEILKGVNVDLFLEDIHPLSDGYMEIYRRNETDIYCAYFSKSEEQIVVQYSLDNGGKWKKASIPYQEYQYGIYKIYLSFVDENTGYLLYCGEPGCGQMNEVLFKTNDGGQNFVKVKDISNQISDYPCDMEFLAEDIGFIIMTYHGNGPIFYQTNDGGNTWSKQSIELPETEYAYAQGNKLTKSVDGAVEIIIELETCEEKELYVTYYTNDGIAWKMK